MTTLNTKNFTTLVRDQVTAIQGAVRGLVDLSIGSILRSIVEANSSAVGLWLQGLILQLLATTRAATSSGIDLDSWVADFGLTRLAAVFASGQVTFSRFTASGQVVIPINSSVETADGTQQYIVTIDTTNPAYSPSLGGYVLADTVGSINVLVTAVTAGTGANAQAGQINTITQALPGVDTVYNSLTFANGVDAESDSALRTRFIAYLASLSKATKAAIGFAITSLQQGLSYSLTENFNYAGAAQNGYFYAVVDDGTGTPPGSLITTVNNAIDAVRPFTSTFGVYAPSVVNVDTVMTATIAAGYDATATKALIASNVSTYINSLALGQSLNYTRIAQVAYDASPGVFNISGVTLNGATADITATNKQVIKSHTMTVS